MIRFLDVRTEYIEYDRLNEKELSSYFLDGNQEVVVCVTRDGRYMGIITHDSLQKKGSVSKSIEEECLVMDETVWQKGRAYFSKAGAAPLLPVVDSDRQLLCLAWQDMEANRELRMLRELEECEGAITFQDLNPGCTGVMIYGCNELAWYFLKYLSKMDIEVNVSGRVWEILGIQPGHGGLSSSKYEIWAEGVHQKSGLWEEERLRSASVEFECVDKVYEANIKAEKIMDAECGGQAFLGKLGKEKQIVIRGTGTKAQDAYNWLMSNGIDICAFQSGKVGEKRKTLFGRPIMDKEEIGRRFKEAFIIECSSKHSAWGFGDVDLYDYEGYERNKRYLLLRDYVEVPENNLNYILAGKNVILTGDVRMCSRVCKWLEQHGTEIGEVRYWDILKENDGETEKLHIPMIEKWKRTEDSVCLLIVPQYSSRFYVLKETVDKYCKYVEALIRKGISDYSDYFSDIVKSIHLEIRTEKYRRKELTPAGVLIGAIPAFGGNILFKQSLAGHPQIITIEEYNFFVADIYSICIRLAEYKAEDILSEFKLLCKNEIGEAAVKEAFLDYEIFCQKLESLIKLSNYFTSQELFVMFHLAYDAMYGRDITNVECMIIYWEPHCWEHGIKREFAYWLDSAKIKGYIVSTMRNGYVRAGSRMKLMIETVWACRMECLYGNWYITSKKICEGWKECEIRFEDLKCNPREILKSLCNWMGILFDEILMETTLHGSKAFYGDITGFDIKPAYNLYEEFFSCFDRMRICMLDISYQKKYNYPYLNCLDFSRRELQEFFLKEFRWEKSFGVTDGKDEKRIFALQNYVRHMLWLERFAEIMDIELDEKYRLLRS